MRTRRKTILAILMMAGVFAFIAVLMRDREPHYQGRSLSDWLAIYMAHVKQEDPESKTKTEQAGAAVRNIGTNALPILLKRIQFEPSSFRVKAAGVVAKLPRFLWDNRLVEGFFNTDRGWQMAENAAYVFLILRSEGAPAVPRLTVLMLDTNRPNTAALAVYCLAAIGQEGLPSLLTALANPQLPCCKDAALYLGVGPPFDFGTNTAAAIPLLARLASNTNKPLATRAISTIGHLHLEPEIAIPALTNALCSPHSIVRYQAAMSISAFGADARGAIPALRIALADPSPGVRMAATNMLSQIAPEALR